MIVRGKADWASLYERNDMSKKYQIDICNIDAKTVKQLEAAGIDVKTGEGEKAYKERYIIAKADKYRPRVLDRRGDLWDENVLIGNGSDIKASVNAFKYNYKGKDGIGCGLNDLMVTSLIERSGVDELDPEDDNEEDNDEL